MRGIIFLLIAIILFIFLCFAVYNLVESHVKDIKHAFVLGYLSAVARDANKPGHDFEQEANDAYKKVYQTPLKKKETRP